MIKKAICIGLVATMMLGLSGCVKVEKVEKKDTSTKEENYSKEKSIKLEDDFYGYINKKQLDSYKIAYTKDTAGLGADTQDEVTMELVGVLENLKTSEEVFDENTSESVILRVYDQAIEYIDHPKSNATSTMKAYYERIEAAKSVDDLEDIISELANTQGIFLIFTPNVKENYFDGNQYALELARLKNVCNIPLKDLWEDDEVRKRLHTYAMLLLDELGVEHSVIKQRANELVYFALDIAAATDFDEMENGNSFVNAKFYKEAEVDEMMPGVSIKRIEEMYQLDNPYGGWMVTDEEQLQEIASQFKDENLQVLKTYMICELAMQYKDFLGEEMQVMKPYGSLSSGPKLEAAMMFVGQNYCDQFSEIYKKYCFSEKKQADYQKMFEDIIQSYDELMTNATWLTEETREGLKRKLHNMVFISGGGDEIQGENAKVGKDLFETYINIKKWNIDQIRKKIGKEINREESQMQAYVVNAAYLPSNTFTVSVAIGKGAYYSENASYEENLGGLGVIMGHEIGHAFDSTCLAWDENGKYNPDWICKEDQIKLQQQLEKMEDYFSNCTIMKVYHVDGKKTSGENYADVGAMECVTNIVKGKEERKHLFENYAKIWSEKNYDKSAIKELTNDVHSPAMIRVNGVLSTLDAFYETYDIHEEDGMYIAPDHRAHRWFE